MRLTCPNCDAQYEVPDEVIPLTGRDVQCSNCGETWFHFHPDHNAETDHEAEGVIQDQTISAADQETSGTPQSSGPAPSRTGPARRELDPAVAEILRQEAEAERAAREERRSQTTLESQPDLGLDAAQTVDQTERRAQAAKARVRPIPAEQPSAPLIGENATTTAALTSRRDLLPDIEQINSTLRSSHDRDGTHSGRGINIDGSARQRRKGGFRTGFFLVLLIAAVLSCLYIFAPVIIAEVPASEDLMTAYIGFVDQARIWLDRQIALFRQWLDTTVSGFGIG